MSVLRVGQKPPYISAEYIAYHVPLIKQSAMATISQRHHNLQGIFHDKSKVTPPYEIPITKIDITRGTYHKIKERCKAGEYPYTKYDKKTQKPYTYDAGECNLHGPGKPGRPHERCCPPLLTIYRRINELGEQGDWLVFVDKQKGVYRISEDVFTLNGVTR